MSAFGFEVLREDRRTGARRGRLLTSHGAVETPVFMPVATRGAVKGLTSAHLRDLGIQILLANAYHLFLRPGVDVVREAGGLHDFMGWHAPVLTDSGGFQVFSLADTFSVDDEGVRFRSVVDGVWHAWSPEDNVRVQEALGADIIMQLDQCPPYPAEESAVAEAVRRSVLWAARGAAARTRGDQAFFGIVQGGVHPHLRRESVEALTALDLPGYGIGGFSVGEPHEVMLEVLGPVTVALPREKPRYLMGVGNPTSVLRAIALGVDMFDCVLPTRTARMGTAFSSQGRLNLRNAGYARDEGALDPLCSCHTCTTYSRSYLRHLVSMKEMTGAVLLTIHNLHFLLDLTHRARSAIEQSTFDAMLDSWLSSAAAVDY
jgi:queuine tRNA-ribosyltransferase